MINVRDYQFKNLTFFTLKNLSYVNLVKPNEKVKNKVNVYYFLSIFLDLNLINY